MATRQLELTQQNRFQDSGIIGVQYLPHTKTPDLLQVS